MGKKTKIRKEESWGKGFGLLNFIRKYYIILVLFIGIPLILLIGYAYVKNSFKQLDYLTRKDKEYSLIQNHEKVTGIILSYYSRQGNTFVYLIDSAKIWLPYSENDNYDKYLLWDFLEKGDSLVKFPRNDTLYIYRQNEKYFFVLGKRIK